MKKSGLQDMKKRNLRVIMDTILSHEALSRIEIAQITQLSPSTVSALVAELLDKQVLTESGVRVTTAGRSRTELTVNGEYGAIAVAEIGRTGAVLHLFDMALQKRRSMVLCERYIAGNELLIALTAAVFESLGSAQLHAGKLAGFGLLFQEDMHAAEFNVMYSTGLSSASISLREALITQFKVPVVEEYSQAYSLSRVLEKEDPAVQNSAHLAIGSSVVLAGITLGGRPLELRGGICADITPLLGNAAPLLSALGSGAAKPEERPVPAQEKWTAALVAQLGRMITVLCTLFPLQKVFISGRPALAPGFAEQMSAQIARTLPPEHLPQLEAVHAPQRSMAQMLAGNIRLRVLCG